jgi:hypothetical protein
MTTPPDTSKRFYLQFKKADGSFEIIGPYRRRAIAVIVFKKRYLLEYGVPVPSYFFGAFVE